MPWRYRFYRALKDSPGSFLRWATANLIGMVGVGVMIVLLDLKFGRPETRWGLDVWFAFVLGFTFVVLFNVILELLGLGYTEWKAAQRPSR